MQELRLVGIADDGEHLLLTGDGERYRLALDDELRTIVRRDRRVTKGGAAATQPDSPLRPRDVQGLIRGGVPLEEIAERAGWSLEKVQRYEGPIRAERDYVSERAQAVVLPSRTETVTLRERASARLADRGVEAERVAWDSWKTDETHWTVVVRFPAGGRLREATWLFDPVNHSLRTVDDEARWLGGDELASAAEEAPEAAAKSATTKRKRAGDRHASVYDVEAEGGVADAQPAHLGSALGGEELTASMRARQASRSRAQRGRSSGTQATSLPVTSAPVQDGPVEPLDLGTTPPPAPSHPRPSELTEPEETLSDTRGEDGADESGASAEATETAGTASTTGRPTSKRRKPRRGRAERPSVRSAIRDEHEDDDGGLFDDLPGFQEGRDDAAPEAVEVSYEVEDEVEDEVETDESVDGGDGQDDVDTSAGHDASDGDADADAGHESDPSDDATARPKPTKPSKVPDRASKSRAGRPSVPSWDDIMFGGRNPKG